MPTQLPRPWNLPADLKLRPIREDAQSPDVRLAPCLVTFPEWDISIARAEPDQSGRLRLRLLLTQPTISQPIPQRFLSRFQTHADPYKERQWLNLRAPGGQPRTLGYLVMVPADIGDDELEKEFRHMESEMFTMTAQAVWELHSHEAARRANSNN